MRVLSTLLTLALYDSSVFAQAVRYTIDLADPTRHMVQVTMEISAGRQVHELQMPVWDSLYQVRDFSQYINWIRAEDHAGHPLPLKALNPSRWRLEQAAKGALVTYQMFRDDPDPFGAQLNSRHAFFNPAQLLIYADDLRGSKASVAIRNIPSGWKVATPLSSAADVYNSDNYDQLADSPIEISNFQELDFSAPCGRYRVIMDAQDAATLLPKIMSPIEQIVTSASKWMNDCPFQQYMFIYHLSSSPGSGGMEHAFATAITLPAQDATNDLATITGVTAHEFFHLWNVKRIRPKSLHPIDYTREMDTTALWFSEGCDSTVADYILLRAGLLDEARYLDHLGQAITELENRTAHSTESAEQSSLDAWLEKYPYYGSPERSVSYYNKGNLLGVLLDLRMRDATQDRVSLQTLFRWLNQNYAKRNKSFADSDAVRQAAENLTSADFRSFFSDYVSGVREIPWNAFFASVGLRVTSVEATFPDWGFSAAQNLDQPPTVASVIPGSAAEQIGLTPGDTIEQVNGAPVRRDYQKAIDSVGVGGMLRLRIRRDDQEQELQWSLGVRRETVYHLEDVPEITSQQKARRRNWLFDKAENPAQ